jgi:hypothetical protein
VRRAALLLALLVPVVAGCGDDGSGSLHQQQGAEEECIHTLEDGGTVTECQAD